MKTNKTSKTFNNILLFLIIVSNKVNLTSFENIFIICILKFNLFYLISVIWVSLKKN